ncbi:GGDEF domain-containing protein [Ammoniphilus resinae]|uniref:Diguanylate cyclase (GGDEF)-like protein n=1 Tax=Ammoniphilus resinae TaxID=861532 RepID=A0ABS4GWE1_9BACL|nr:GGDEF domain-containing protein [Ammoniphilus resinae]MBP1934595.1 diguanylate cyclase (GGDEF)-like protein [Ammoniphilus resinae]
MRKNYIVLALILAAILLPVGLRCLFPNLYPFFWTFLIVPAVLVPNWRVAGLILFVLTSIEYLTEWALYQGQASQAYWYALVGGTVVQWIVFSVITFFHIEQQKMVKLLHKQTLTDSLTGLYNRRYLDQYRKRLNKSQEAEIGGSFVLILDVDRFKKINDMYGHLFGDEILRQVSQIMRQTIRSMDTVIRMGGEEFVILMQGISSEEAKRTAYSIQNKIGETRFIHKDQVVYITVSMGMTAYSTGEHLDHSLEKADHALYQAKISGRNRIVIAS